MIRLILSGLCAACLFIIATVANAQSSYRVQQGDMLVIEVLEDPGLNRSTAVLPDGNFSFPYAGTLRAGGRTVSQIESAIRGAIASNFANPPTVFVSVQPLEREPVEPEEPEMIKVYLLGEVGAPGLVELEPGSTILHAIAIGGGPSRFAATKRIQLRRTDPRSGRQGVSTINYRAMSQGAGLRQDIILRDGDVILVPERRLFE
ncbi:polysaccharide biosynthesis/export family protein [Primorskyibacter flagellatus]|nr:polysaccharide biosynthesis/export family protein [Primorskyibacter flagellatus]